MKTLLRTLLSLSLIVWIGAEIFFPIVAAVTFNKLRPDTHTAGTIVGQLIRILHGMGLVSGMVALAVLALAGGKPEHVARMTWYVTSKREYLAAYKRIGEIYRGMMGRHYPAMTAVEVSALVEDGAKVEIEATAVIPD